MKRPLSWLCFDASIRSQKGAAMSKSYLGVDVHKKMCVFSEIDSEGKLLNRGKFGNTLEEVSDFAATLSPDVHLVLEPVLNYLWLLDQLEPYVGSVHVAVPHKVRVIAESKCKTDRYDARVLADLLRTNFLPESWVPPHEIRVLRNLVRQRYHLVKTAIMNKNRIRHLLFLNGSKLAVFDIASPKARQQMRRLCLSPSIRQIIDQCLQLIAGLEDSIKKVDEELRQRTDGNETIALLQTIPGIGKVRSAVILAEIGQIERFRTARTLASYTGLVPTVRSSGDSTWTGGITRLGSKPLRHVLVEASINVIRESPDLSRMFHRILYRSNVQKARIAVARKMAVIIYAMLRNREPFRVQPA
jgi:transposase